MQLNVNFFFINNILKLEFFLNNHIFHVKIQHFIICQEDKKRHCGKSFRNPDVIVYLHLHPPWTRVESLLPIQTSNLRCVDSNKVGDVKSNIDDASSQMQLDDGV